MPLPIGFSENSITVISQDIPLQVVPQPQFTPSVSRTASLNHYSTRTQYWASLACAGGGFAYGTVLGWASPASSKCYPISGGMGMTNNNTIHGHRFSAEVNMDLTITVKSILTQNTFYLNPVEFSWVVTIFALGAALTAVPAGLMMQYLGRRITMFVFLMPLVIGWMLVLFASNFITILIGRLFLGISCGTSSVIVPIYTGEISVPQIRGRTGALFQTMVNTGILFMFVVGPFVNLSTLVFISAIVTLVFYAFFYFAPETPTFLVFTWHAHPFPLKHQLISLSCVV